MANQKTPTTDTVEDYTVEKIILSGAPFVSSILGPGAYRITNNAPPVFYTDPVITGYVVPPSVLTCGEGSFNSSPRATLTYQWKRDTVDITDETNNTYTTIESDIGLDITCEVTLNNSTGADTGLSNIITPEAITDTYVTQLDVMCILGFGAPTRLDVLDADLLVISGMTHNLLQTVMATESYIMTGLSVSTQAKIVAVELYTIFLDPP